MAKSNQCTHCGSPTNNPAFCSITCSSTHNNRLRPRKFNKCIKCNAKTGLRRKYCDKHTNRTRWDTLTIAQIHIRAKQQYSSWIRYAARQKYKQAGMQSACKVCGYSKVVHICHIKAINSFSHDTVISIVNDIKNLVGLCPNHHWEFDHGLLKLFP